MKSYYFALLTALVWGIVPVFEKMGLSKLSPAILTELSRTLIKYIAFIVGGGFTANFLGPSSIRYQEGLSINIFYHGHTYTR